MNPLIKKVVVSLVYAVGAAYPAYSLAVPGGVTPEEWGLVVGAFVAAFWGTFKSNTTVIEPSRAGETIAGPPKA